MDTLDGKAGGEVCVCVADCPEEELHSAVDVVNESDVGSPPVTDEDRRDRHALKHDDIQGGRSESKLDDAVVQNLVDSDGGPALSINDPGAMEGPFKGNGLCWQFGSGDADYVGHDNAALNAQVVELTDVLGSSGEGKRAIVAAIAGKEGVHDAAEVERIYNGTSDQKLRVPRSWREALRGIGMEEMLAPINIVIVRDHDSVYVADEAWHDLEFEVALDSGSVVHVCSLDDCRGYKLQESPGSRHGQEFMMGDGGTIPNLGESKLNLTDTAIDRDLESVFQIAAVARPLMSVGKMCDEGHTVTFNNVMAVVYNKDGAELARFHRSNGGLYVAKLKLRSPVGFPRPE